MARKNDDRSVSLDVKPGLAKAVVDRRILATVHSVSRSGMSRKLKFMIAVPDENTKAIHFIRMTHNIAQIIDCRYNKDSYP